MYFAIGHPVDDFPSRWQYFAFSILRAFPRTSHLCSIICLKCARDFATPIENKIKDIENQIKFRMNFDDFKWLYDIKWLQMTLDDLLPGHGDETT